MDEQVTRQLIEQLTTATQEARALLSDIHGVHGELLRTERRIKTMIDNEIPARVHKETGDAIAVAIKSVGEASLAGIQDAERRIDRRFTTIEDILLGKPDGHEGRIEKTARRVRAMIDAYSVEASNIPAALRGRAAVPVRIYDNHMDPGHDG